MAKPMGKGRRRTKRTYLGSGAGSLRSGTGATAKAKQQKRKSTLQRLDDITKKLRTVPIPKKAFRPITPKSPATGLGSVFGSSFTEAKKRRKRTRTMRRQAKR